MQVDNEDRVIRSRPIGRRVTSLLAILAMGSWLIVAAIPMVVAIVALT